MRAHKKTTAGTLMKLPVGNQERKIRTNPKGRITDPTHTWRTGKDKEIAMIEDAPDNQEAGQT